MYYRIPLVDGGHVPIKWLKMRSSGLPDLIFVSLGALRQIAFASLQPVQYFRVGITGSLSYFAVSRAFV